MDLFRKSGYKEPNPILEKKRRKSELVIMWQSIWDVTITTLLEFYINVLGLWEALKFYFNSNEQQKVRKWLIEYLPREPNDFSESWRDGILLSILLNKLQPGCCPGAEYLDANYALRNLYHVFQLLEYHFNITPKCTVEEIITCSNGSDSKLLELLLQLKNETDAKTDEINPLLNTKENDEEESNDYSTSTNCVARGTGLMVGFVGRAANFIVFFASISDLDLVVEIKGPCETVCSERITKRSPKKKEVLKPWIPTSPHHMTRSSSNEDRSTFLIQQASKSEIKDETRYIPLEYEVHSNRICFAYMPLMKGQHQIKILSRGMHVSDSPYNVAVAPVGDSHKSSPLRSLKSSLKVENSCDCREPSKATVRFQDTSERKERLGNIIKRRVLRYIVKIDNKDVVVDTDSIDNLATSLLKMDYDFQKPPLNRRNSWGFVGDAERKVSVIRQFCVNMDELEAQSVKLHRSQSISGGSGSNKIPFNRRGSCEDIPPSPQKKLETVEEGTVSHFDTEALRDSKTEEETLVYMNEDFDGITESIKNEEECDLVADKQISMIERAGDSLENVSGIPTQNDVGIEIDLYQRRNANTTLNSLNDENKIVTQIENISKPLDLFPSAREISSRLDDEAEEQTTTMSNFDKTDHIIFPALQSKEKAGDIQRETKPSCYQIDFTSFSEGISAEKFENNNIPKAKRITLKAELSQNEYQLSPENKFFDEVFIEEVLCTKTDVRNVNQTCQNKREISNPYCSIETPIMNSVKPKENFESMVHLRKCDEHSRIKTQNWNTNESLKIQHKSKRSGRWYCKTNNRNRKSNKKKMDENQRYMNSKLYRKPFEGLNQNTNIFSNIEEYNEIRIKPAKNMKINNALPSFIPKRMLTNNSNQASSIHTLKDSYTQTYVSCNQKKYRGKTFFKNNLKDEGKLIPQLQAKKINIEFPKNNFKEKSITQMPSFTQVSEPNSESNSIQDSSSIETSTSLTLCQLNFRHFNPTLPNQRNSLVKDRISQYEENAGRENVSPKYKHNNRIVAKSDITSRLNFWETVTKENKHEEENRRASGSSKSIEENTTNVRPNTLTPSATYNKKIDEEFVVFRKTRRSASYPGTVKTNRQSSLYTIQRELEADLSIKELTTEYNTSSPESMSQQAHHTSSAEYPSTASIFDNSTDDEDSSVDLLDSTEDEYIDDEISESAASAYWGDISAMDHLKSADSNEYRDICRIVDGELWGHNEDDCASECQVFGIATYFGYVAVKNRFQVLTKGTGSGNLSATLQGFGRHDVSLVCVRYLQRDLYEVTYQVMSPGLYLISVRWMERPIAGSPFLCKVTF
ncbi:hypothetical protein JTE90_001408 [Oedothorax gibbosus]|uniref:Calponin-homology (CH) domain-containing protein n=1 Tax=Oedothorax gibbosus TaxID=931172 RepID=A0AAV6VH01_9ARAC|nr:hypothetical protein JTE90_001408 [Oedothorax gibbosus]